MKISSILGGLGESGDLGAYLAKEISEGIEPITERVSRLEKKIDLLIFTMERIDASLRKLQPLYDLIIKLPFFKK